VVLFDAPEYFDRPNLYGRPYEEYPDNAERDALFARASLSAIDQLGLSPDIVHAHDWPTGLVPVYLALERDRRSSLRTVFTVHNLAFQGLFPLEKAGALDLPQAIVVPEGLEFYHRLSFMKGGLMFADVLTTVSPEYAREIQTEGGGMGLDGVARKRRQDLFGILNGIDHTLWNPRTNPFLPAHFDAQDLSGKAICKAKAQEAMGLAVREDAMLCTSVSRITAQKGFDLFAGALVEVAHRPIQIAIHGNGDPHLESLVLDLARVHPSHVAVRIGFDPGLAQLLFGGADAVLVPSRFEPGGLAQLHGLAYGAVPIVRATGGLKDTVTDVERDPDQGSGFVFDGLGAPALAQALLRAEAMYRRPEAWRALMARGMAGDHAATTSAANYVKVYQRALEFAPHRSR
jgi:starch synthase